MIPYHFKWTWARRWRRWGFFIRYRFFFPWGILLALSGLAVLVWWAFPSLQAFRQNYCILYLMIYETMRGAPWCLP